MTMRSTPNTPWDDERVAAAFAARAARARTPDDLSSATSAALRTRPSSAPAWRALLVSAAVVILAVGAVTGGVALLGEQRGSNAPVDVRTLDADAFTFAYPADWQAYDSSLHGLSFSSIAVLGSEPVEPRCGDERHVDLNCVNERPLQPSEIRMLVSTVAYRNGPLVDRPDVTDGSTSRFQVDGSPAILDDLEPTGVDEADRSLHLYVQRQGGGSRIVQIDLLARDHPTDELDAIMQQVIGSFRFDIATTPSESPVASEAAASPEPTPGPTPAWGPWPPPNAFSVLEFKEDAGRKPRVAVVDESGLLDWVQEGVPDPAIEGAAIDGFFRDPSGAHRYRLRWTTTICDREMTVSIARGVARIVIEAAPRQGCDAMAIGRDLVLRFTEDVAPADVELQIIEPTILPESPPEPTTMVVGLERGDSTESVLVIDHAGSLMEARPANSVPTIPDFIGVRIVRAEDGGTIVVWDGLLCDRDHWISIEADDLGPPDRIVVHGTRVEPCRMALVRRAIWLDIGPVNVASIRGQPSIDVPSGGQRDAGPVIGVAEALVIRSHRSDDHQLQVRGWYWGDPAVYDCIVPPSPPPALESGCHGPRDRLVADPEDLTGPWFVVWLRPGVETPPIRYGDPSEVVVIGHFDDTLAEACGVSTRDSCRDVFVIEEVLPASAP
jgi:hypothetical protein